MDDLKREIMIMKQMKHNNIVMLSEVGQSQWEPVACRHVRLVVQRCQVDLQGSSLLKSVSKSADTGVGVTQVIDDPAGSKLLLVMEYMEGGPVLTREALEKRERLPESLARQYFRDMIKALDYLHCHKVGGPHQGCSMQVL
jgi:serine/threonine protein kinase